MISPELYPVKPLEEKFADSSLLKTNSAYVGSISDGLLSSKHELALGSGSETEFVNHQAARLSLGRSWVNNSTLTPIFNTPLDFAGNSLETARDITVNAVSQIYTDWAGYTDPNDYYRFFVSDRGNFNLSLNGMSNDGDVQLLNSAGAVIAVSQAESQLSERISTPLEAGTYYIRVYPYNGETYYNLQVSLDSNQWYDQTLGDSQLLSLTRSLASDGNLSRNDMISILRNSEDGNVIDATELKDLRTILNNHSRFNMEGYVVNLANKIVNGNLANINAGFGNLYAGSSGFVMENLIGKWFLGNDRPDVTSEGLSYQYTSGSLFQNNINANDIRQGLVGDCYYLSSLSSIAQEKPSNIQDMFIDNGDNTFTVRFFNNGVADYVTVDRYLPTNQYGYVVYAGLGNLYNNPANELWVSLAEKAYAQLAQEGWSRPGMAENSYAAIEGGWMDAAIQEITGLTTTSTDVNSMTQSDLINLVNSNQILTAGFIYGSGYGVINDHAYTITGYDALTGRFHLRNPWGFYHAALSWQELLDLNTIIQYSNV